MYNSALKERKDWYNSRKCQINSCWLRSEYIIPADGLLPRYSSQCKALTAYRKTSPALQRVNAALLQQRKKVALLHEYVANCRKDWHRKLLHQICDGAGMVFVQDLNLVEPKAAMLGKHCLDAGFGQFFNILEQTCFKRGVFLQKVDAKKTSLICPNSLNQTGKKELSERVHSWHSGYTTDRDVAAAQVVLQRGLAAVGHRVKMHRLQVNSWEFLLRQESPRLIARECQIHGA